jgi:PAS domain S-box-containing protein
MDKLIALDALEPGMLVVMDVLNSQAQILLPANSRATPENIDLLVQAQVPSIWIKSEHNFNPELESKGADKSVISQASTLPHVSHEILLSKEKPDEAALSLMNLNIFQFLDSSPVPTFVINKEHTITHWNKAAEHTLGYSACTMISSQKQWQPFYRYKRPVLADLIIADNAEAGLKDFYHERYKQSTLIKGAYEVDDFFPNLGESGLWLHFTAAPLFSNNGEIIGAIETLEDITERCDAENALRKAHNELENLVGRRTEQLAESNQRLEADIKQRVIVEAELVKRNAELMHLNEQLSKTQQQLLQSEKLASIGQLAAGVAHEINNPVGYVFSNFGSLESYIQDLFEILTAYEKSESTIADVNLRNEIANIREKIELTFLKQDIPELMRQSKEGIIRVRKIVQDLKDFSRVDTNQTWQKANLQECIESTLNIVNNEIKYKADVIKEFGTIPEVECLPFQINQVIMNLVVNASHAIGEERGKIIIRTYVADTSKMPSRQAKEDAEMVIVEVEDTGMGMPKEITSRIFDPFFTTKPIGKGTGLGLSIAYGIIQKHHGSIEVVSTVGKGSCFKICLPIKHIDAINSEQEVSA